MKKYGFSHILMSENALRFLKIPPKISYNHLYNSIYRYRLLYLNTQKHELEHLGTRVNEDLWIYKFKIYTNICNI